MPLYRTYSEGDFLLGIWKSDETTEQLLALLEHKDWYEEKLAVFSEKRKHFAYSRLCGGGASFFL